MVKYYTIKEAARITGVKPHVLRYWEKEFKLLRPKKNTAGRRIYSEDDINLIKEIIRLLHVERYSIKGAKKKLEERMQKTKEKIVLDDIEKMKRWLISELEELKRILLKNEHNN